MGHRVQRALQVACWLQLLTCAVSAQSFRISEFMARNESAWSDPSDPGSDYSDWIEIENTDADAASLAGWSLTDDPEKLRKWQFPDLIVAGSGYLIITADDDLAKGDLDASFSLDAGGEYLALVSPDGIVVDQLEPTYPPQLPDLAWGRVTGGDQWDYLNPTPAEANGEALLQLPLRLWQLTENPEMPGADESLLITVRAKGVRDGQTISAVTLFYLVNFDNERSIDMIPVADPDALYSYSAELPADAYSAGEMIRWRVEAVDSVGNITSEPPFKRSRDSAQYHGTVVIDPDIDTQLPVLHWFVERPTRADTRTGTQASVFYQGKFYDNIFCRTRGQSTANWEKPKYKFDFHKGRHFYISDGLPKVEEFNLNSFLRGQTREPAMFTYLTEAGANAPHTFYLQLRQNGGYYGLFGYVEQIDKRFLRRHGFDATGSLYKAAQVPATMALNPRASLYEKHLQEDQPYTDIQALATGINVRNDDRFTYFADHVNVPNYINVMAAMMVPFNHDQLTKNYYLYRDPNRNEWFRFPWDADQAFPTGRANTMENWTSPLYGDKDHTQELRNNRPNPEWQNHLHANVLDNPVTREMYLRRVRTLMDTYLAQDIPEPEVVILSGEKGVTNAHYHVPSDGSQDSTWFLSEFDHSTWDQGPLGFGFETLGQDYEILIGTRVRPFETSNQATSIYLRIPFTVESPEKISYWTLRMKYDDGFVAYLNGTEVARANITGTPAWTSQASSHPDSQALEYENFLLNDFTHLLLPDENILAVQIANVSAPSSDLLVVPEIVSGNPNPSGYFERLFSSIEAEIADESEADRLHWRAQGVNVPTLASDLRTAVGRNSSLERRRDQLFIEYATGPDRLIPDPQPSAVSLNFSRVEADPIAGGQDAEFLELINPNTFAVDISGWQLDGGIRFTFPPGSVIASNTYADEGQNRLNLSPNVSAYRQRSDFPLRGGSHFVIGNYSGHLSNLGETVTLTDTDGHVAASISITPAPSDLQQFLRITEIMYHPGVTHPGTEFIELTNTSSTTALELAGVHFSEGIDFTFAARQLAPGQSILLVEDSAAFELVYGDQILSSVVGIFQNGTGLNNGGEAVKLEDPSGNTIVELRYNDKLPWPEQADGTGVSLVLASAGDPDNALSWQPSTYANGNPGIFAPSRFQGDIATDADGDGLNALVEFALGTSDSDSTDASTAFSVSTSEEGTLQLNVQRSLGSYMQTTLEVSQDMQTWSPADSDFELEQRLAQPADTHEKLVYAVKLSDANSLYVRLKASL
ncbi:MAG: hypothetical protein ACI9R3_003878 [Verrucomicrobiales bacterium]|jgi:hypothetical protein